MIGDIIEIERAKHSVWLPSPGEPTAVSAAYIGVEGRAPASEGAQQPQRSTVGDEESWVKRLFRIWAALPEPR